MNPGPDNGAMRADAQPSSSRPQMPGQEVACRPLRLFFDEFERQGLSPDALCAGTELTRERFTRRDARVDWTSFRRLIRNASRVWNDDELVDFGRRMTQSRGIRVFRLIARLLYGCDDLYRWNFKEAGVASQLFTCIHNEIVEDLPGKMIVDTWMSPGFEPCPELYQIFRGSLSEMPRVLGLRPASVAFEETPRGVRYTIRYPAGGGLLGRFRRFVARPFVAQTLARELQDANDQLFAGRSALARLSSDGELIQGALRESEHRFFKVFHAAPTLMMISSINGRFIDVNENVVRATGYERKELIGRNSAEFPFWRDSAARTRIVERLQSGGSVRGEEVEFANRSGESRVGLVSAEIITLSGEPCVIWHVVDITDRKRAEQENRRLQEGIPQAQKLESLGVMASGIAHDFNNLLVGMLGNAQLALEELGAEPSPMRAPLEAIETASRQAAGLTREMLAYAGASAVERELVEFTELVDEVSTFLRSGLSKQTALISESDGVPVWVHADPTQVRQVVMNLITNASESCGEAGGTVRIRTAVSEVDSAWLAGAYFDHDLVPGKYALIEVEDNGSGMDVATQKRIFDPFFSTKFKGRGLGLAATLGIVRSHGGTLAVRSTPGRGTVFQVLFPQALPPEGIAESVDNGPPSEGEGVVLIVDDEEAVRSVAQMALGRRGYRTYVAEGGTSALELFRQHADEISVVVLDLTMPDMSGEETFRKLRELRSDVPVVCCSGLGPEAGAQWISDKPGTVFVAKPYSIAALTRGVAEVRS